MKYIINIAIIAHVVQMFFNPAVVDSIGMFILAVGWVANSIIWLVEDSWKEAE